MSLYLWISIFSSSITFSILNSMSCTYEDNGILRKFPPLIFSLIGEMMIIMVNSLDNKGIVIIRHLIEYDNNFGFVYKWSLLLIISPSIQTLLLTYALWLGIVWILNSITRYSLLSYEWLKPLGKIQAKCSFIDLLFHFVNVWCMCYLRVKWMLNFNN